jgi:hypothetical protein
VGGFAFPDDDGAVASAVPSEPPVGLTVADDAATGDDDPLVVCVGDDSREWLVQAVITSPTLSSEATRIAGRWRDTMPVCRTIARHEGNRVRLRLL